MYAIEILMTEHENVLRLCRTMRDACLTALECKEIKPQDFRKFLHIIREYADRHHHGKEEALLFREMEKRLGPPAQTLVRNGMLVEHDLGRLYARQMEEAIDLYEKSNERGELLDIITNAMAYVNLLKRHIERENEVVYPYGEKNLSDEISSALDEGTKDFERSAEESGFLASILMELTELEKRYGL